MAIIRVEKEFFSAVLSDSFSSLGKSDSCKGYKAVRNVGLTKKTVEATWLAINKCDSCSVNSCNYTEITMKLIQNKDKLLKDKLFIEWYKSSQILDVLWVSFLELHFAVCVRHVSIDVCFHLPRDAKHSL